MKNITVSIDEQRRSALPASVRWSDTSVSALVRGYLSSLASGNVSGQAFPDQRPGAGAGLCVKELDEVFSGFDARGGGLRLTTSCTASNFMKK